MKKTKQDADPRFPQDGSPISRELWLEIWPISKAGNEWVRAFGATYTIKIDSAQHEGGLVTPANKLTVVGPGGVRFDRVYIHAETEDDIKALLWNDHAWRAYTIEELELGSGV